LKLRVGAGATAAWSGLALEEGRSSRSANESYLRHSGLPPNLPNAIDPEVCLEDVARLGA